MHTTLSSPLRRVAREIACAMALTALIFAPAAMLAFAEKPITPTPDPIGARAAAASVRSSSSGGPVVRAGDARQLEVPAC